MGRPIPDNVLRGELLRLARESGCVVCHAARAAVDRFFAWYRIEQYHEPSIIQRMQEARGFCPQHTRQFVATSSPTHLVSAVYRDLLASAVNVVRSAAREPSALPGALADRIHPQAACLACEHQEAAVSWIARGLSVGLTDSQMRAAILRPSALCLPHFIHLLPSLDWEAAQLLAHAQLASLAAALAKYDTGAEPTELVRLLVGATSDEAFPVPPSWTPMTDPADTRVMDAIRVQDAQGTMGNNNMPTEQASWSPAVANIEARLNAPGCPLCREEVATVATYLSWLSQELSERTPSQAGDDVYWLCRSHLWHFIEVEDKKVVKLLLRSVSTHWMGIVQALISDLDQPPPTRFVMRCWHGMLNARQRTPGVTAWHALWEGIAEGRRSMTKRLAEMREPLMRVHLCPACRFQQEHADRLADLLDRALGDAGLVRCYEDAFGICFRHLPLAISHCTEPGNVKLLLHTQYTRIAVAHWELEEYWRKLSWTYRWEPRGDEQTAWCRAVAQYTGTDVIR